MIKKYLKKRLPIIYNKYIRIQELRLDRYSKYLKSLDKSEYPIELAKIFYKRTGEELDWNNLQTYNEKMQWAKLYEIDERKTVLTDKYRVREFVNITIGAEYLIPLLGVWDSFDMIDFEKLPDQFVLKTNHGCGANIIVKDKNNFNKREAKEKFNRWLSMDFSFISFEMQYGNIEPKIIAERYIENNENGLDDYKFFCFNGEPYYCEVHTDRYYDHRVNIYDMDWNLQEWHESNDRNTDQPIPKPYNFDTMKRLVKKLSSGFSHVRVDLYNINGKIYFGEMTFTSGSGFDIIHPRKYDLLLGDLWKLPIS